MRPGEHRCDGDAHRQRVAAEGAQRRRCRVAAAPVRNGHDARVLGRLARAPLPGRARPEPVQLRQHFSGQGVPSGDGGPAARDGEGVRFEQIGYIHSQETEKEWTPHEEREESRRQRNDREARRRQPPNQLPGEVGYREGRPRQRTPHEGRGQEAIAPREEPHESTGSEQVGHQELVAVAHQVEEASCTGEAWL